MSQIEPGQSEESFAALGAWERAVNVTGEARSVRIGIEVQMSRLRRELQAARTEEKRLQRVEDAALRTYEATPWARP